MSKGEDKLKEELEKAAEQVEPQKGLKEIIERTDPQGRDN